MATHMHSVVRLAAGAAAVLFLLAGCAATGPAPQQATQGGTRAGNARVATKMSSTIFLQPVASAQRVVYVEGHNTSSAKEVNLEPQILSALRAQGYTVTGDPAKAEFILQYNLRYLGEEQQNRTATGALAGGFGGAVLENAFANASGQQTLRAGVIGAGIGALVGYMLSENHYMMVVDVRVQQRNPSARTQISTNADSGSGNITRSSSAGESGWQIYQTRVVGEAAGQHLTFDYAKPALEQNIAGSIAGIF